VTYLHCASERSTHTLTRQHFKLGSRYNLANRAPRRCKSPYQFTRFRLVITASFQWTQRISYWKFSTV